MYSLISSAVWLGAIASVNAFVPAYKAVPNTFSSPSPAQQQQQQQHQQVLVSNKYGRPIVSKSSALFMGWGPEPIWSEAQIEATELANESGSTVRVLVQVPAETAADYKVPGQYVQLTLNNNDDENTQPLFLAIASAPDAENPRFEFLIKKTDNNDWITNANVAGTTVQISQVLGNGFPMKENLEGYKYDFPCQNVLLFAAGSGIAPLRAAMESGQLNVGSGGGRTARLYYGVQTAEDLCYVSDFAQWEQLGFQVVPVLSQPGSEWAGRTGYVQNCLEEDGVPIPRNSGALLCGMKGMAESVTAILSKAGVFEGRIMTNF